MSEFCQWCPSTFCAGECDYDQEKCLGREVRSLVKVLFPKELYPSDCSAHEVSDPSTNDDRDMKEEILNDQDEALVEYSMSADDGVVQEEEYLGYVTYMKVDSVAEICESGEPRRRTMLTTVSAACLAGRVMTRGRMLKKWQRCIRTRTPPEVTLPQETRDQGAVAGTCTEKESTKKGGALAKTSTV